LKILFCVVARDIQEEQEEDEKCADAAGRWGMQSSSVVAIHDEPPWKICIELKTYV
jgi:hypothetical protein